MMPADRLELFAIAGLPLVEPGTDLAAMILDGLHENGESLRPNDVVVIAQKIVSKAEGRTVNLAEVTPSAAAVSLARDTGKDARLVELIMRESSGILRHKPGVIVAEHRLGYVLANAGIDASNVSPEKDESRVLLLPEAPDATADRIRRIFEMHVAGPVGVIINDSIGRAWRNGTIGTCLGSAGVPATADLTGNADLFGRSLMATVVGVADELAAAASILQGQANERQPVVVIRGFGWQPTAQTGAHLIRDAREDMFR